MQNSDFPLLKNVGVYLDSAATTLQPKCVIDAVTHFMAHHDVPIHRGVYQASIEATQLYEKARAFVRTFLNAEEVVFTKGTTAGMNLLARGLRPKRVLISAAEHHANIVPWQMVGAELVVIPVDANGELGPVPSWDVDVLSIAHVCNTSGAVYPIKALIEQAKRRAIPVVIDGAQAVAHEAVDLAALGCDFYLFSGHKVYGPKGVGILAGTQKALEALPPTEGGGDMIDRVQFAGSTYAPVPLKFEAGTPNAAAAIGLAQAIAYFQKVGREKIARHEHELVERALERLQQIEGIRIIGNPSRRGALISFVVEGIHPLDLMTLLDCKGFALRSGHLCSQPALETFGVEGFLRISFGLYNTVEEVDRFANALEESLASLSSFV